MFRFMLQEDVSSYDLSSLKYCTIAGEALNPDVFNKWYEETGIKLMEGFGQTETTLSIYNPVGSVPKSGSMGIPSPLYDVDLILPDGTPAALLLTEECTRATVAVQLLPPFVWETRCRRCRTPRAALTLQLTMQDVMQADTDRKRWAEAGWHSGEQALAAPSEGRDLPCRTGGPAAESI